MSAPERSRSLGVTREYHERTKHRPSRYAASLGYMDWATQPDPFRRYEGAALLDLEFLAAGPGPRYDPALPPRPRAPAPPGRPPLSPPLHAGPSLPPPQQARRPPPALPRNPPHRQLPP